MGARRLLMAGAWLALCAGALQAAEPVPQPLAPTGTDAAPVAPPGPDVMRKWSRSCALCHVDGNAGAPRVGHPEEWQPRLAKGRDVLMQNTIEGFNKMPPLGYCMACEREDFRALIDFMAGEAQ